MASRVNVKFVIILSAALVAIAVGSAGLFVFVKYRSGDRLARMGELAIAKGDIKAADFHYSKAVAKEPTNVQWLTRWREIREQKLPDTQTVYEQEYSFYVYGILRQLAKVQRTNVQAHRDYLEAVWEQRISFGSGREGWEGLVSETEENLKYFEPDELPAGVRRYRGLGLAKMVTMDVPEERLELAKADLRAAVEADPADSTAAFELATLHRVLAERALQNNRQDVARAETEAARQVMQVAIAQVPQDATLQIGLLWLDAVDAGQAAARAAGARTGDQQRPALREAMAALQPRVARLAEELKAGQQVDAGLISRFLYVSLVVDPARALSLAAEVTDNALAVKPESAELLALRASIHSMAGEFDRAEGIYQRIIEVPPRPISLEGIKVFALRRLAYIGKVDSALSLALQSTDEQGRKAATARAQNNWADLIRNIPEQSPELAFIDGKMLFVQGDYRAAQRKLDPVIKGQTLTPTRMVEAMSIMAEIGLKLDPPQPGLTRDYLTQAVRIQPGSLDLRMNLARVEILLQNHKEAIDHLRRILDADPAHSQARASLDILMAMEQRGTVEDPVLAILVEVDRTLAGDRRQLGDENAAIRTLEENLNRLEHDPRLVARLAGLKFHRGDREGAMAVVRQGLERRSNDPMLSALEAQMHAASSLEGAIAFIDADTAQPPLEKHLSKYRTYNSYGKKPEADAALAEAARLAPEDPRVLEYRFVHALQQKDLAEASRLVQRAIATDADRAEGDTFKARLFLAEGNRREAALLLQRAVDRGNPNAAIYRLLGSTYIELGRGPEAITAYKRGLELNPSDPTLLKVTLSAYVQLGNLQEAVATARDADAIVRRDSDLRNLWLGLEAAAGNLDFARGMREQIRKLHPDDRVNAAALAEIYIGDRAWDRARQIIDTLRKEYDALPLVELDARWHAARGDWSRGRQVYIDYISRIHQSTPELLTPQHFNSMAQFLLQNNQTDLAIEALANALPLQDPATMTIDLAIADLHMNLQRFPDAEERYRKVLAANVADPDLRIRKRLIECLVQQRKSDDISRQFASLGDKVDSDPELLCLQAEHHRRRGDTRSAQQVLDRAVSRFPQEPLPYYRRARMLLLNPQTHNDALADLAQAIRVRPGYWPALRTRAQLNLAHNKPSEAVSDLRAAHEQNPGRDELLMELIRTLLQLDRESEAADVAATAARTRSQDARLMAGIADAFAVAGRWSRAAPFYKRVWEQQRGENDAIRYITALLEQSPPNLNEAEAVLENPALDVSKSRNLLLTRANIRKKQRRLEAARADALNALRIASDRPELVLGWSEHVRAIFPEPGAAMAIMNAVPPAPALDPWLNLAKAITLAGDKEKRAEGMAALRTITANGDLPEVKVTAVRVLSSHLAEDKKWQEATDITRVGLELAQDDVMFNNNMAYFMAMHLDQGAQAVPYAEKAVAAAPANGSVLETLASACWAAGDKARALQTMENALRASLPDLDRAKMIVRLGDWRLESGDRAAAARALDTIRDLLIDNPSLAEHKDVKEPLETLQRKLGAS
jgi:tetratricopeptide (TPR) repeat protein